MLEGNYQAYHLEWAMSDQLQSSKWGPDHWPRSPAVMCGDPEMFTLGNKPYVYLISCVVIHIFLDEHGLWGRKKYFYCAAQK